jgi:F-box and leucine-rich repeat protein GRR1
VDDPDAYMDGDGGHEVDDDYANLYLPRAASRLPPPPVQVPSHASSSASRSNMTIAALLHHPTPSSEPPRGASSAPPLSARRPGFGEVPLVEAPASPPPPSDTGSFRSNGTATSNGAGFFRTYVPQQHGNGLPSPSSRGPDGGAHTPDLVFAEIGHGRGIGTAYAPLPGSSAPYGTGSEGSFAHHTPSRDGMSFAHHNPSLDGMSFVSHHHSTATPWGRRLSADRSHSSLSFEVVDGAGSSSSSSLAGPSTSDNAGNRSAKRTFRSTLNAASHLFGRSSGDGSGRNGGPSADAGARDR